MTKTIYSLVEDMYEVVRTKGGWDATITEFLTSEMGSVFKTRFEDTPEERGGYLRMSSMGTPCERKLWYQVNKSSSGEGLPTQALLKFLYGDMLEVLLLALAKAAGHDVKGCQDSLEIAGVVGHRDAVIDGITIDCKSASPYSFTKFKEGALRDADPFGYISQLSSYVYAGHKASPDDVHEHTGAFLVINKVSGELCLDIYHFNEEIANKEEEFERIKQMVQEDKEPDRGFDSEPDGYYNSKKKEFVPNGNEVLGLNCSYCEFKKECWPGLRAFMYSRGQSNVPKYFTHIKKMPKVMEIDV